MPPQLQAPTAERQAQLKAVAKNYGGTFGGGGAAASTPFTNPNIKAPTLQLTQPQNIFQKAGSVVTQAAKIGGSVAKAVGKFVVNTPKYVYNDLSTLGKPLADIQSNRYGRSFEIIQKTTDFLDKKTQEYDQAYSAGKLSKSDWVARKKQLAQSYMELSNKSKQLTDEAAVEGDKRKVIIGSLNTAADILSLGIYTPVKALSTKAVGEGFVLLNNPATKTGFLKFVDTASLQLEEALQRIPAFRELVIRNTQKIITTSAKQLTGETTQQFLARNGKNIAIGLLIKRPIVYQTNIGLAENIHDHLLEGNYPEVVKDSAWLAVQALGGGPLGYILRKGKSIGIKLGELARGKGSFIDEISKQVGTYKFNQIAEYIKANPAAEQAWRQLQAINLHMTEGSVTRAVENFLRNFSHLNMTTLTPEYLTQTVKNWVKADELAKKLSDMHFPGENVKYVAVRWDTPTKKAFASEAGRIIDENAGDLQKTVDDISNLIDNYDFGNNQLLKSQLLKTLLDSPDGKTYEKLINKIETASMHTTKIPTKIQEQASKLGYTFAEPRGGRTTPIIDPKDTKKLVSAVSNGETELFDAAIAPNPIMEALVTPLRKFGLSPEANTKVAYDKLSDSLARNIAEMGISKDIGLVGEEQASGAKVILSKLQQYINKQAPNPYLNVMTLGRGQQSALQDVRQMNFKEIMEALPGIDKKTAKALQGAILKAYTDVPLEFRGLGIKAFDAAYRVPGARNLFRIQSALRYTYNPFFRIQEVTETKTLAHLKANNLVWMKPKAELDRVSKLMDDAELFTSGYTGESTQDLTLGRLNANLLKTQKRDLAGLALDIAEKKGTTVEELLRTSPDELADALKVIVQYPSKGVLNSPLARTLNIAFFPMRYNIKVAGIVAKEVAKLPPTVQTAFIHSVYKASDWMKSSEGIQWQADNQDAIQIFSYFTVYNNIASVMSTLNGAVHGNAPDSIGQLGQLGGLPFGFIMQIIDSSTDSVNLNTPYVNPKTGDVLPDYIPQTTRAKASVALQGFINTMFTYPGRILGLPGKQSMIRDMVDVFARTNGNEYLKNIRTEDLTPLQLKWIEVLKKPENITQDSIDALYTSPASTEFQWYTLPPTSLPAPVHVYTKTEIANMKAAGKSSGTSAKKKALPIPAQGQTLQLP